MIRAPEENYDIPHYQQRNFWRDVEHPEIGRAIPYPRGPWLSDELGIEPRGTRAAPRRAHQPRPAARTSACAMRRSRRWPRRESMR